VYIIYEGDFEISRRKKNKLTKKEEAHNQVRYINEKVKKGVILTPNLNAHKRVINDPEKLNLR